VQSAFHEPFLGGGVAGAGGGFCEDFRGRVGEDEGKHLAYVDAVEHLFYLDAVGYVLAVLDVFGVSASYQVFFDAVHQALWRVALLHLDGDVDGSCKLFYQVERLRCGA
jgi:hypothetical protein